MQPGGTAQPGGIIIMTGGWAAACISFWCGSNQLRFWGISDSEGIIA
jgi:hypothetical protein